MLELTERLIVWSAHTHLVVDTFEWVKQGAALRNMWRRL